MAHSENVLDFVVMVIVRLPGLLQGCFCEIDIHKIGGHEATLLRIYIQLSPCADVSMVSWLDLMWHAIRQGHGGVPSNGTCGEPSSIIGGLVPPPFASLSYRECQWSVDPVTFWRLDGS